MSGGRNIRVAIIDDEPLARLAVKVRLARRSGFELVALDYLLKPVDDERLDEALDRAQLAFPYRRQDHAVPPATPWTRTFSVRAGTRMVLVPAAEVERIEADGDYATLHAKGKTWLVRERLHRLATQLDPRQFQRVHRSTIVRLDMIAELRSLTNRDALLRLRDGSLLRASRTYMPALADALQHLNKKAA
jgi:two-component system LytT family response regulator